METTLTAKLKLTLTREQFHALQQTQLAYRDALNLTSQHAFAHSKTSNSKRLHHALYDQVRAEFALPSQMACSVFRQVGATYKALWTKWRKNQEARSAGYTKRRFKGLDDVPRYVSPTLTYVYGHDYSFRTGQEVSILTLSGRIHVPYQGWSRHVALIQDGAIIGGAKLWYHRAKKQFYLLISLTLETPNPQPEDQRQIIGVDVGQRYLATVATLGNGAQFYSGKQVRARADHYARLQKRLQRKGTRSATRRRIAIGAADETVEVGDQSHHQQAHSGHPSPQFDWPGRSLRHARADEAEAWQAGQPEAAQGELPCLQMGVCRVA